MNERLRGLPADPLEQLAGWRAELTARGQRIHDFGSIGAAGPAPQAVRDALVAALAPAPVWPGPGLDGAAGLRRAIAGYLHRRCQVVVDADREVLPTLGSREALFHLPQIFVQVPSDRDLVLYGEPAHPVFELGALFAEAWTYAVPLTAANGFALDPDAVPEAVLRRASVVCLDSPHHPTGALLPEALYRRWVEVREQYGFVLVADESQADLDGGGPRPRSLLEFGRRGCLVVHSLSERSGLAAYRSGFLAGDAEAIATCRRFRAGMGLWPTEVVQAAATVAWADAGHVEVRKAELGKQREVLLALCQQRGLRVHGGPAGLYLWVEVPAGETGVGYAARLREHGILVVPGTCFGRGQERFVRWTLGASVAACRAAAAVWPH
jgi:aspartate/methionine/tyrosine aminotransferase